MIHFAAILASLISQAPTPVAAPAPKPPVPTGSHHQFDFWLGEWEVRSPGGQVVGHSRIESIANGFGILENWSGSQGGTGKSLNAYDPVSTSWHQAWVGQGGMIHFDGGMREGKMWLEGKRATAGGPILDRMTYEPRKDGTVRQLWETSKDEGQTWQIGFDGIYVKTK